LKGLEILERGVDTHPLFQNFLARLFLFMFGNMIMMYHVTKNHSLNEEYDHNLQIHIVLILRLGYEKNAA